MKQQIKSKRQRIASQCLFIRPRKQIIVFRIAPESRSTVEKCLRALGLDGVRDQLTTMGLQI